MKLVALSAAVAAIALLSLPGAAQAQVSVERPWVRATVAQQQATGAFMVLRAARDTRLVAVSSPLTPQVELHEMKLQDNVMKMREVPAITLKAGQPLELKPGGYHVMLMGLKGAVTEGQTVALTLVFEGADGKRESVPISATVRALNAPANAHGDGHQAGDGHKAGDGHGHGDGRKH
ncbi:MAG TPA: copper chaperone PCu(A)C [Burkholderiaceae bacterium]|nr:copper chaperone PCu(A)C [Burkholderiaceae bacterium]